MAERDVFRHLASFSCSREELYRWHTRPGALERLIPPWERTSVIERKGTIDPGGEVVMRMHAGPFPFTWVARHVEHDPGKMFRDVMHKGPFSMWSHSHVFSGDLQNSTLEDYISYALPMHQLLPKSLRRNVRRMLQRTFQHREQVLRHDLELHKTLGGRRLKILVSGASGVLGRALCPLLTTGGHEVWTLVRRAPRHGFNELYWNPAEGVIDQLPFFDAVFHLAGEYIGLGRWTSDKKREVIESRTKGTRLLADAIGSRRDRPAVFLSASAVGYYGDTGDSWVDEDHTPGTDFISEVCRVWEEATAPAVNAGIRTVRMRIGISLSPGGGALQRLLATSAVGFFRKFGKGNQYISWLSLDDTISAMYHAMQCDQLEGAVNITAPAPVTNEQFMETLADVAGRPRLFSLPQSFLTGMYGQMAKEILLSGCRASCDKLLHSGFRFRHDTLEGCLRALLGKFHLQQQGVENTQ